MKRLLVINQYYYPDLASTGQYAHDICTGLATYGFKIIVITGKPSYSENSPDAPYFEEIKSIKIYRISLGGIKGREDKKTRFKGYIRFLMGAWKKAREILKKEKFDIILTFHNPPFVGFLGSLIAKKYKLKFIYIPYDIHPDVLIKTGWKIPKLFIYLWEVINRLTFKTATKIVVLSEGMKKKLVENKRVPENKVIVIPLWAKPEINLNKNFSLIRKELGIKDNELFLLYAGNMGILHPLEIILEAVKKLKGIPVKFLFIGDGVKKKYLLEKVKKEGIQNVYFLPFQTEEKFVQILNSSDVCILTIGKGLENLAFPSKVFTFLSAGKPVITVADPNADIAKMVRVYDCGWNVRNENELALLLLSLCKFPEKIKIKGYKAKEMYNKLYKKEKIIERYAKLLKSL